MDPCKSHDSHYLTATRQDGVLKSSYNTSAASTHFANKKLSLKGCWSTVSINSGPQQHDDKVERGMWIKFLMSKSGSHEQLSLLNKMSAHYQQLVPTSKSILSDLGVTLPPPIHKYGASAECLPFFALIWLRSMGYKTESRRNEIISKLKLLISLQNIHKAVAFYETLGAQSLSQEERWQLVEGTCRNGWEFFIFESGRFLKQ